MNRKFIFFFITLLLSAIIAQEKAPGTIHEALLLKAVDYYRNIYRMDPVEADMVYGTWKAPSEGDKTGLDDGETSEWRKVYADSNGWFNEEDLRDGYAYIRIQSDREKVMILEGMGYRRAYVNGEMRTGNMFQYREERAAWEPNFNFCLLPVLLKPGQNDLLIFGAREPRFKVLLHDLQSDFFLNIKDVTLPDLVVGEPVDQIGAVVVTNATRDAVTDLQLAVQLEDGPVIRSVVSRIPPLSVRKVGFRFNAKAPTDTGKINLSLSLLHTGDQANQTMDQQTLTLAVKNPFDNQKRTFISEVDGSVQYYGLLPAQDTEKYPNPALFLSLHGAGVEAINQSASYMGKSWGHLAAPTNRRPYGFNWEDWGRLDALEVLDIMTSTMNIDPNRVYLTGHSMGGHGNWHIGALYPDRFAAIGPSAGWLDFWSYRARNQIDMKSPNTMERMLMRATLPSQTLKMIPNLHELGIYVIHGATDDNVFTNESRLIVKELQKFHKDLVYHEEPDVGHWWDHSDEPGVDCVDWPPLFDFFARHTRPLEGRKRIVEFQTPSPGISARNNWVTVDAQKEICKMSKVNIRFDPGLQRFVGQTENVVRMAIDLSNLDPTRSINVELDNQKIENIPFPDAAKNLWLYRENGIWFQDEAPAPSLKGRHRYGTFKDAFKNRMILVYGTKGTPEENKWAFEKSRYDAEYIWYLGNGAVDVIPDFEFDPAAEPDRNVIIYGNANTNSAWQYLLGNSPVQVRRDEIRIGKKRLKGNKLGCLFIRPRFGSAIASIGVFTGTDVIGMRTVDRRPAFAPGFAYPDLTVFSAEKFSTGQNGTILAGFFGLDWRIENGEFIWEE